MIPHHLALHDDGPCPLASYVNIQLRHSKADRPKGLLVRSKVSCCHDASH
jgi:hypothetical protein